MRTTLTLDDNTRLPKFKVIPKACGFRSGVDVLRLNQLNDELEVEDFQKKERAKAE
ncbi:MAG TPA: hypothetical protein VGS07_11630 [Thermoanaerobaculia bacterium]|jgi:hypothetical protein|nr:hypothetical protein [Thermoanaerobaculia bacterium]